MRRALRLAFKELPVDKSKRFEIGSSAGSPLRISAFLRVSEAARRMRRVLRELSLRPPLAGARPCPDGTRLGGTSLDQLQEFVGHPRLDIDDLVVVAFNGQGKQVNAPSLDGVGADLPTPINRQSSRRNAGNMSLITS